MSRGNVILAAILWSIIGLLVLYPLSILLNESVRISGTETLGLGNYLEFFQDPYYLKVLGKTLLLSTLVLITTTVLGIPLSLIHI